MYSAVHCQFLRLIIDYIFNDGLGNITTTEALENQARTQYLGNDGWHRANDLQARTVLGATLDANLLRVHCQCRDAKISSKDRLSCLNEANLDCQLSFCDYCGYHFSEVHDLLHNVYAFKKTCNHLGANAICVNIET